MSITQLIITIAAWCKHQFITNLIKNIWPKYQLCIYHSFPEIVKNIKKLKQKNSQLNII